MCLSFAPSSFRGPIFSQFASLNLCGNSPALVEETFFWLRYKQMEELVDISQDCGPLLFCCYTVAAPPTSLPRFDRTRVLLPEAFILAHFLFLQPTRSPPPFLPLLKTAPHLHSPPPPRLSLPPLPLFLTPSLSLTYYVLIRSADWGLREACSGRHCLENQRHVAAVSSTRKKKRKGGQKCKELLFPWPTLLLPPVYFPLALSVCWLLSLTLSCVPQLADWVHWHRDHYLLPGD